MTKLRASSRSGSRTSIPLLRSSEPPRDYRNIPPCVTASTSLNRAKHMKKSFLRLRIGHAGGFTRYGHRVICADDIVRAVELAPQADTFFSIPAWVRHKGKRVSGYVTQDTVEGEFAFRPHLCHHRSHPELVWPSSSTVLVLSTSLVEKNI